MNLSAFGVGHVNGRVSISLGILLGTVVLASPVVAKAAKLRVLVETDAGGDLDDEASLVRFLLYANEWAVEGIIADRPRTTNQETSSGLELCRKILKAYGDCHRNLVVHKPDYPTHAFLSERLVAGYDHTDDGVNLISRVLRADDPRPVWFANWGSNSGTTSNMKRALDRLKRELPDAEYRQIVAKIHVTRNAEKTGNHVDRIPLFVDTRNPDRWYHRFRPLTQNAGGMNVAKHVQSVGPLGKAYSTPKEGDSLAFVYLIPTGLSDPTKPTWGGWGGRYAPMTHRVGSSGGGRGPRPREGFYWASAEDTLDGRTSRDNTLARWAVALQNDFRARLAWSITLQFSKANHEPSVVVQGDSTRDVLRIETPAGKSYPMSAAGTRDPDGDELAYRWYVYPEPSTYRGAVVIQNATAREATLLVPSDAVDKTIHVILEVTDNGSPALTRYRRIVVTAR
jgi:hypothetical protein